MKEEYFMPVKCLNQFSSDFKIKVRVTKKHDIRSWKNANGTGELFNVDLIDADGTQIQGTFFKHMAKKWFPLIQEDKVYEVSCGQIKIANKKFTSITNDYCISFSDSTDFKEVKED